MLNLSVPSFQMCTMQCPLETLVDIEPESESEFNLFEPHIQNKYLNMIIGYEIWIRRSVLRPVWSLSQGPPKLIHQFLLIHIVILYNIRNKHKHRIYNPNIYIYIYISSSSSVTHSRCCLTMSESVSLVPLS